MDNVAHARRRRRSRRTVHRAPLAGAALALAALIAGAGISDVSTTTVATSAARHPSSVPAAGAPVYGGHLVISGEAEAGSPWTPAAVRCDQYCYQRARTFFDTVGQFGTDGKVHGMLAESITPNDDYTQWTIKVRPGITFTDGTPLNAAAVAYNLQAAGTSQLVSAALRDVARVPDPDHPDRTELKIEQTDDMTLVIYTGKNGDPDQPVPWRDFDAQLTAQWGMIASPFWLAAVEQNPDLATKPVGTGPFVVDSFSPRESMEVSRNPDYWMTDAQGNRLPYLDSITFRVIEDSETAAEALQSGDIDMMSASAGGVITEIQDAGDEYSVVLQDQRVETYYVMFDLDKAGPIQDERVRCAMNLAIDRDEFSDALSDGFDPPAYGLFSPGQQGYLADNGLPHDQDIDAAKALIDQYESETGNDVTVVLGHTPPTVVQQAAELLMDWWSQIGIDVTDKPIPQNDFINNAALGTPDFEAFLWRQHGGHYVDQQAVWWYGDAAQPDGSLSLNFARLRDDQIDADLDTARQSPDDAEATAAAEDINRTMAAHCYNVPIVYLPWGVLSDANVQGVGQLALPDGSTAADGAGAPGQFNTQTLWIDEG